MSIWHFISDHLSKNIPCVLLVVAESIGSSPGRQGFKMAISAESEMYGSIGGGIMEHKLVALSLELLQKRNKEVLLKQQIHNKTSGQNRSGLICSGEQTVIMLPLYSSHLVTIQAIQKEMAKLNSNYFKLSSKGIELINKAQSGTPFQTRNLHTESWSYSEQLHHKKVVHIIGAGHVGLALSKQMSFLGFYVRIIDNRPELNTLAKNSAADEKIIADYSNIEKYIEEGVNHFVVIMSFGYRDDKLLLKALYKKQFGYLGMMGSQAKINQLYQELEEEGIAVEEIKHVHAPIGIGIASKTPAEIAVSIAAEIIRVKNGER